MRYQMLIIFTESIENRSPKKKLRDQSRSKIKKFGSLVTDSNLIDTFTSRKNFVHVYAEETCPRLHSERQMQYSCWAKLKHVDGGPAITPAASNNDKSNASSPNQMRCTLNQKWDCILIAQSLSSHIIVDSTANVIRCQSYSMSLHFRIYARTHTNSQAHGYIFLRPHLRGICARIYNIYI